MSKSIKVAATKSEITPSAFFPWLNKKQAMEFDSKYSLYLWKDNDKSNFICVENKCKTKILK